jgi:hypothetical protein
VSEKQIILGGVLLHMQLVRPRIIALIHSMPAQRADRSASDLLKWREYRN